MRRMGPLTYRPRGHGQRMLKQPPPTGMMNMKTDSQPQQDVLADLKWEHAMTAAQIGVEVKD
jgi:hypothetical protein